MESDAVKFGKVHPDSDVSTEIFDSFFKDLLLWLTIDPASYSETLINVYQTTRCHIPELCHHTTENLLVNEGAERMFESETLGHGTCLGDDTALCWRVRILSGKLLRNLIDCTAEDEHWRLSDTSLTLLLSTDVCM